MRVSLIAAVAENGVIGKAGNLPWRLPDEMKFFMRKTTGHHVVTGRGNYEAMGRPLPRRVNIVVTRRPGYSAPGCKLAPDIEHALEIARAAEDDEVFIIGGSEIYRLALPHAHRFYLTRVHGSPDGDVFFPRFDETEFREISSERHEADARHAFAFTFCVLERLAAIGK